MRKEIVKCSIGVDGAAVGRDDQLRVRRGLERLAQDVDPPGQGDMHRTCRKRGNPHDCGEADDRGRGRPGLVSGKQLAEVERLNTGTGDGKDQRNVA